MHHLLSLCICSHQLQPTNPTLSFGNFSAHRPNSQVSHSGSLFITQLRVSFNSFNVQRPQVCHGRGAQQHIVRAEHTCACVLGRQICRHKEAQWHSYQGLPHQTLFLCALLCSDTISRLSTDKLTADRVHPKHNLRGSIPQAQVTSAHYQFITSRLGTTTLNADRVLSRYKAQEQHIAE